MSEAYLRWPGQSGTVAPFLTEAEDAAGVPTDNLRSCREDIRHAAKSLRQVSQASIQFVHVDQHPEACSESAEARWIHIRRGSLSILDTKIWQGQV